MGSPVSAVDINVMYRLTLAVFVSLALAVRAEPPSPCHGFFTGADFGATLEAQCSPIYGHFVDHTSRIHHLTNEHLRHSIFFSMMSSFFKSDTPNRAGFSKYMEAMADKMWDDAVELIKYAGMRGVFMKPEAEGPYNTTGLQFSLGSDPNIWTSGWRGSNLEVEAMSLALDRHRQVATSVQHLHELSGHVSLMAPLVEDPSTREMAIFFIDQSLA